MAYHPFRNPWLKLVSLVLAALLWLTVSRDQVVERNIRVPLEFQNIPEGIEIVGEPPVAADVRVRGPSNAVSRVDTGELVAVLDLGNAREGQRLFHLLADQVRAPFGVEVVQISPPTVSLAFERSSVKAVPVVAAIAGTPADGFVLGQVTSVPATVEVIGPESRLSRLTEATTEPIRVENATATVRDVVTVGVADSAIRLREPRTALVTVAIAAVPINHTVAGVVVRLRNLRQERRAVVTPKVVTVTLHGPGNVVKALEARTLDVFVDLADRRPGQYVLPVQMGHVEGNIDVVRIEPATLRVRIQ